ncbi:regulator of cytokinesis 1, partial [Asbolus verrucosus]
MDDIDERTIENKPWARRLLTHSLEITRKAVLNWCNIVTKIGESELDVDNYVSIFIQQIETLYEDLIVDVDTIQEKSLDKIMKLLQQMQNLCRDLQIEIPTFNYEEVPLTELRKMLLHRIEEYESLAEIRRKELRELHQKELKLCKSLGREPKFLSESPLPPPSDVEDLRALVESLENEVLEREEKFFQLKEQIVGIVEELQVPASLDFEKEILSLANTEVRIMDSDMEQLQLYHDRLVKQSESVKEEISELRAKVDGLWDKLETDIGERDVFRQNNTGNSLNALNALKQEVERLEEMKKANIKVFINKQRQELSEIWEKCHCTEEDTNMFTFYYSECYSEDLFELHEREIQKWKAYYEENKELFELLQEHDRLWNELCKLESNSGTANRYKNRGGQLLIEEKLRNKLTKRIPKIEESLTKLSDAFLMRKGKRFLTFGKTIEEYIVKLHEDRDKEFKLKLSAKKQQREQVSTVGRSRMNLFPPSTSALNPTLTPRACSKRKVITTPITEPSKKLKTTIQSKCSKSGMPKLNISKSRRLSKSRRERRRQRLSFKSSMNSNKENHDVTASTSYNDFE